jgi:hypothetical protein
MVWRIILGAWICGCAWGQGMREVSIRRPLPEGGRLAIGFLGALEKWNDEHRAVRRLTLRLREQGWEAESFSHRRLRTAKRAVVEALDRNGNGRIDGEEAAGARVVIYGQSMGGGATVKLARFLRGRGVPVLLTVQVDSFGARDAVIPDNVREAANFYQHHSMTIRGEDRIRAADPTKTKILGNFEQEYPWWKLYAMPESWQRRVFGGAHARMEADPLLWLQVESLIQKAGKSQ